MGKDNTLGRQLLPQLRDGMTDAARAGEIVHALDEMLTQLEFILTHLGADNLTGGKLTAELRPRDEASGREWRFSSGHIYCGTTLII